MNSRGRRLACLRITPTMCVQQTHTWTLLQIDNEYFVKAVLQMGRSRRSDKKAIAPAEVKKQLDAVRASRIPAYPVSPDVCDGEYVELILEGEMATLTLGWWTIAPEGAEPLEKFSTWLRKQVNLPKDDDVG